MAVFLSVQHLLEASRDGAYVAAADHAHQIHVGGGAATTMSLHCVLPRYKSHPTALAFHPNSKLLVVAYADHKVGRSSFSLLLFLLFFFC